MIAPQPEQARGDEQLLAAILPMTGEIGDRRFGDLAQQSTPQGKIDWLPVVGIDQAEIPELAPLVDVGHARHAQLQNELGQ